MKLWHTQLRPRLWRATFAIDRRLSAAYSARRYWSQTAACIGMGLLSVCGCSIHPAAAQPAQGIKADLGHIAGVWRLVFSLEYALMLRYSSRSYWRESLVCIALAVLSMAGFNVNCIPARKPGAR